MPTGIYERTEKHKYSLSRANRRLWAKRTEEEKLQITRALQEVGTEAMKKKFATMSKGERFKYMLSATKASQGRWGRMSRDERFKFMSPAIKASQTLEVRRKIGKTTKERFAKMTKEERTKFISPALVASQRANPSSIEKMIWKVLNELGVEYRTQVPFNNSRFIVDVYIPAQRLIIECNGNYWHNLPRGKRRDKRLRGHAKSNDYKLIELWESEIRRDPEQALKAGFKNIGVV